MTPEKRRPLYHFTCGEHGWSGIRHSGWLLPNEAGRRISGGPAVVWLTDEPMPIRELVGLTSKRLMCDRMEFRLTLDLPADYANPWSSIRDQFDRQWREDAERFGRPSCWFVSLRPIPIDNVTKVLDMSARRHIQIGAAS